MKKLHHIVLFCVLSLPFLGQAQTAQVHIAGNTYPVGFGDTSLSATNRQRIASDLSVVFSLASSFEELKGNEATTGVFHLGDTLMFMSGEDAEIFVIEQNKQKGIRVNKALSDKYLQAFAIQEVNSNAVQKAHEFVALINSTNLLSQSSVKIMQQIGHISPQAMEDPSADDIVQINKYVAEFKQWKYLEFSVLNFVVRQVSDLGEMGAKPVIMLFMINKSDPSEKFAIPFVFHNGKWGLGGKVPGWSL